MTRPVLACLSEVRHGDAVLHLALTEADRRGTPLHVLITGPPAPVGADAALLDLVERWAEKFPATPVTTRVSHGIDAAVSLTAATRGCALAVVAEPVDAKAAAVLHALSRRTHCPVVVAGERGVAPAAPRPRTSVLGALVDDHYGAGRVA